MKSLYTGNEDVETAGKWSLFGAEDSDKPKPVAVAKKAVEKKAAHAPKKSHPSPPAAAKNQKPHLQATQKWGWWDSDDLHENNPTPADFEKPDAETAKQVAQNFEKVQAEKKAPKPSPIPNKGDKIDITEKWSMWGAGPSPDDAVPEDKKKHHDSDKIEKPDQSKPAGPQKTGAGPPATALKKAGLPLAKSAQQDLAFDTNQKWGLFGAESAPQKVSPAQAVQKAGLPLAKSAEPVSLAQTGQQKWDFFGPEADPISQEDEQSIASLNMGGMQKRQLWGLSDLGFGDDSEKSGAKKGTPNSESPAEKKADKAEEKNVLKSLAVPKHPHKKPEAAPPVAEQKWSFDNMFGGGKKPTEKPADKKEEHAAPKPAAKAAPKKAAPAPAKKSAPAPVETEKKWSFPGFGGAAAPAPKPAPVKAAPAPKVATPAVKPSPAAKPAQKWSFPGFGGSEKPEQAKVAKPDAKTTKKIAENFEKIAAEKKQQKKQPPPQSPVQKWSFPGFGGASDKPAPVAAPKPVAAAKPQQKWSFADFLGFGKNAKKMRAKKKAAALKTAKKWALPFFGDEKKEAPKADKPAEKSDKPKKTVAAKKPVAKQAPAPKKAESAPVAEQKWSFPGFGGPEKPEQAKVAKPDAKTTKKIAENFEKIADEKKAKKQPEKHAPAAALPTQGKWAFPGFGGAEDKPADKPVPAVKKSEKPEHHAAPKKPVSAAAAAAAKKAAPAPKESDADPVAPIAEQKWSFGSWFSSLFGSGSSGKSSNSKILSRRRKNKKLKTRRKWAFFGGAEEADSDDDEPEKRNTIFLKPTRKNQKNAKNKKSKKY